MFGQRAPRGGGRQMPAPMERGLGSGVIVSNDGYILTNNHVVEQSARIQVELSDRRVLDAKLIGADEPSDLAVIKIEATNLPVVAIGDSTAMRVGDLVLAVDDVVVNRFREVERATQKQKVQLAILRDGKEMKLDIDTMPLVGEDLNRIVVWAGAVLHMPHRPMAAQRGIPPLGVFVAYFSYGSPSTRNQLWAGRRIVEVDGQPTPDLDAFLKTVSGREERASVRLRTVSWNGAVEVITLKLDKRYWPAYELRRTAGGWQRTALE